MSAHIELADVLRSYLPQAERSSMPMNHYRTLDALSKCRTAALGGHVDSCDACGHLRISYNSCRNRHCPKCQGVNKEMWIVMQEDMLLPVAYYHVVFTLPHELNVLCMYNPSVMYDLLFKSSWYVIHKLAKEERWIGAKTAATMVLHSWSQTLQLHPHVHCIVPNGGIDNQGNWRYPKRGKNNFLFPVVVMRQLYKGYFMQEMRKLIRNKSLYIPAEYYTKNGGSYDRWKDNLYRKTWVVYTKKPFSGVKHVIDYLGRYSHRVAITNRRIKGLCAKKEEVTFRYKDYKDGAKKKEMNLGIEEFVRRFRLHILPKGFRKIRQYGFAANATKKKSIALARKALGAKHKELLDRAQRKVAAMDRLTISLDRCPNCASNKMKTILTISSTRPPPQAILDKIKRQSNKTNLLAETI